MPRKEFQAFTRLDASDVNEFLMDQTIMVFAGTAARGSAIPSPVEGMYTHINETDSLEYYDGSAWESVGGGGGGGILQVVSEIKTDTFTTTSTSFTALTGLSASITPSSTSSKVLAIVSIEGASTNATVNSSGGFRLMRDSTAIGIGDTAGSRQRATGTISTRNTGSAQSTSSTSKSILDTPATTSAITYSVEVYVGAGTLFINRTESDTDSSSISRPVSTLTLMEVAG
jgi:hypothetical protein